MLDVTEIRRGTAGVNGISGTLDILGVLAAAVDLATGLVTA